MNEVPQDLHPMNYAIQILQEILGWPAKGNQDMMHDCLVSIMSTKKLTAAQSYKYLVRAIKLGKEQGQEVNRMWFQGGEYMNVRPSRERIGGYVKPDWKAIAAHQETPEFKAAWEEMLEKSAKAFGVPARKA